jgi:Flp pilus assembly protein TadD
MTRFAARWRGALVLALAVLVAACSNAPRPQLSANAVQPTDRGQIEAIATLLDQGRSREAKKRIMAALKRDPLNPNLMLLRESIDRDPQKLLGPKYFSYAVRQGDTIASLAQRFLGNRLKSYQLARYNAIKGPAVLSPGEVLHIPGEPAHEQEARVERSAKPEQAPRSKAAPASHAAVAPAPRSVVVPPPPTNPAIDAAAARKARSAGLLALNEGDPRRAVSLLSRAAALDPGNPAIARDLTRAKRINETVKARK